MRDVTKASPALLSKMMAVNTPPAPEWRPDELSAMFRHQMTAPVEFDLGALDADVSARVAAFASQGPPIRMFADLFFHPSPPVELLRMTKEFAKAYRTHPTSPFPTEIATTLYFLSIITARLRCGARITELDDESVRRGAAWAMSQPWVDERTRELFREGFAMLEVRPGEKP